MENLENNYISIARNDLLSLEYLKHGLGKVNNTIAPVCQQICEKFMKAVLAEVAEGSDALKTHSLRKINQCLMQAGVDLKFNTGDLATLSDYYYYYYFDAMYPGEDFITVTDEDTKHAMEVANSVAASVEEWWHNKDSTVEPSGVSRLDMLLKMSEG